MAVPRICGQLLSLCLSYTSRLIFTRLPEVPKVSSLPSTLDFPLKPTAEPVSGQWVMESFSPPITSFTTSFGPTPSLNDYNLPFIFLMALAMLHTPIILSFRILSK